MVYGVRKQTKQNATKPQILLRLSQIRLGLASAAAREGSANPVRGSALELQKQLFVGLTNATK